METCWSWLPCKPSNKWSRSWCGYGTSHAAAAQSLAAVLLDWHYHASLYAASGRSIKLAIGGYGTYNVEFEKFEASDGTGYYQSHIGEIEHEGDYSFMV